MCRRIILGLLCATIFLPGGRVSQASDVDLIGREFTLAVTPGYYNHTPALVITSHSNAPLTKVHVRWPKGTPTIDDSVQLAAGDYMIYSLPEATAGWTPGFNQNAVEVTADQDIGCLVVNTSDTGGAAATVLPHDALGFEYWVTTFDGLNAAPDIDAGQFVVMGITAQTQVTVISSQNLVTGQVAGSPFMFMLNAGDAFFGRSAATSGMEANLSGTQIVADQPVAVMEGNVCTQVPAGAAYCNAALEFSWPMEYWDTSHVIAAVPGPLGPGATYYTLQVSKNNTALTYTPPLAGAPAQLNRGAYALVGPASGNHLITATAPIKVTQWVRGETSPFIRKPEMVQIPGVSQYAEQTAFASGLADASLSYYCTVYTDTAAVATITLDASPIGSGLFTAVGGSGYTVARLPLAPGLHTVISPRHRHGVTVHEISDTLYTFAYQGGVVFRWVCPITLTGDVNVNGAITSSDIISVVNYVFKSGAPPQPCIAAGDVNCNGAVTSADIIGLVSFVFKGGAPPCDACTMIPGTWSCP